MDDKFLLRNGILSSPAFASDLKMLLELPKDALYAISKIGDTAEGFVGHAQAQSLNAQFGIPINEAMRNLRIAAFLYNRVSDLDLEVTDAVDQIASIASGLDEPISIDDQLRESIEEILAFKRIYEISKATGAAVGEVPHFVAVNGSWSVKPVEIRNGEIVKVPVVSMSIQWHDSVGNDHEAFFQMTDDDWQDFDNVIKSVSDSRKNVEELL